MEKEEVGGNQKSIAFSLKCEFQKEKRRQNIICCRKIKSKIEKKINSKMLRTWTYPQTN